MYGLAMVVRCCAVSCVAWLDDVSNGRVRWSKAMVG